MLIGIRLFHFEKIVKQEQEYKDIEARDAILALKKCNILRGHTLAELVPKI